MHPTAERRSPTSQGEWTRSCRFFENVLGPLKFITWLRGQTGLPAYEDYRVGSALLAWLERQVPPAGVNVHTFGGTSTTLTHVHQWNFTLDSAIPDIHVGGTGVSVTFHWATADSPLLGISALADDLGGLGLPELTAGLGDVLVTNESATLPFSRHHQHAVHHAQSLWDPEVLADGVQVLRSARGMPSGPAIDDAWIEFIGVPTRLRPSAPFTVRLKLANTGTSAWDGRSRWSSTTASAIRSGALPRAPCPRSSGAGVRDGLAGAGRPRDSGKLSSARPIAMPERRDRPIGRLDGHGLRLRGLTEESPCRALCGRGGARDRGHVRVRIRHAHHTGTSGNRPAPVGIDRDSGGADGG